MFARYRIEYAQDRIYPHDFMNICLSISILLHLSNERISCRAHGHRNYSFRLKIWRSRVCWPILLRACMTSPGRTYADQTFFYRLTLDCWYIVIWHNFLSEITFDTCSFRLLSKSSSTAVFFWVRKYLCPELYLLALQST